MTGKYVVIDGMDGAGKGTQLDLLKQKLGDRAVFTREPGGTPFAEKIRHLLFKDPDGKENLSPFEQMLLFLVARSQLRRSKVARVLKEGKLVFSDRSDSSTFAFQLNGEGLMRELGNLFISTRMMMLAKPDLYLILDLPAKTSRERAMRDSNGERNFFDEHDLAYYERVREGFLQFAQTNPVELIDANRPAVQVHRSIMMALTARMITPEYAFFIE